MGLAVTRNGSGVPIVLLHGFPLSKKMWNRVSGELSRHYQPICVDFPGFGDSPKPTQEYSMEELADQILAALDSIDLKEKFVLAGVSMGGYVSFQIIKKAAHRLRALALIATKTLPDTEETRQKRYVNIDLTMTQGVAAFAAKAVPGLLGETIKKNHPEILAQALAWGNEASAEGVVGALKAMAGRPDTSEVLKTINIPTLVVSGGEDALIPTDQMKAMADRIHNAEFQFVPTAGHLIPIEIPDKFTEILTQFLKRRVL